DRSVARARRAAAASARRVRRAGRRRVELARRGPPGTPRSARRAARHLRASTRRVSWGARAGPSRLRGPASPSQTRAVVVNERTRVVIVGAGPAGAALALLLGPSRHAARARVARRPLRTSADMVGSRRAAARRRRAPDVAGRRDAIVAANHRVPVLARLVPEAPDRIAARAAAVAAIEAERRPEIEAIQAMQTRQTKMFERGYTPLRAALFRLMLRVGPLLRSWSRRRTVFGRTSPWSN